jgi:hypothetical protein
MTRRTGEILAFCAALLIATLAFHAWLDSHDDQLRLQSTLATQKQILEAADARERDRNAALKDTLAQIDALKRQTQTPEQILRELPKYIQLPQPITLSRPAATTNSAASANAVASAGDESAGQNAASSPARSPGAYAVANQQGSRAAARQGTEESAKSFLRSLLHPGERPSASRSATGLPPSPLPPGQAASQTTMSEAPATGDVLGAASPSRAPGSASTSVSASFTDSGNPGSSPPDVPAAQNQSADSPRTYTSADSSAQNRSAASPSTSSSAEIPAADLKPLYDFVQDCRACEVQLAAAKQSASDNALKIGALTRERDAAITSAKGGTFWLRLRRNAHWLVIGAAASAGVLCGTGHCR